MCGWVAVHMSSVLQEQIQLPIDSTNRKLSHVCFNSSSTILGSSRCFQDPGTSVLCSTSCFDASAHLSVSLWFHLFFRFFSKVTVLEVRGLSGGFAVCF